MSLASMAIPPAITAASHSASVWAAPRATERRSIAGDSASNEEGVGASVMERRLPRGNRAQNSRGRWRTSTLCFERSQRGKHWRQTLNALLFYGKRSVFPSAGGPFLSFFPGLRYFL